MSLQSGEGGFLEPAGKRFARLTNDICQGKPGPELAINGLS